MSVFRNLLMAQGKKGRLPSGYTEVEWIENPSDAYIDSNYIPLGDGYFFKLMYEELSFQKRTSIIGKQDGAVFALYHNLDGLNIYFTTNTQKNIPYEEGIHLISMNGENGKLLLEYDNNIFKIGTPTKFFSSSTRSIYLFSNNYQHIQQWKGRIYYFVIRKNNENIRDFVPCINPNGIAGMYDLVEGKFYGSETETQFIAGPIVN